MTANIPEIIHQKQDKVASECVEYRKAFAEQIKQHEGWRGLADWLNYYDKELADVIEKVANSFSKDPLMTPEGLDLFLRCMEPNTLYYAAAERDREIGNDSHQAIHLATAIVQYYWREKGEVEKPVDVSHLKKLADSNLSELPQSSGATSLYSRPEATHDTNAPHPPTDGSSVCPSQSSTGTTGVLSRFLSIFTGSK